MKKMLHDIEYLIQNYKTVRHIRNFLLISVSMSLLCIAWFYLIQHNWTRIETLCSPESTTSTKKKGYKELIEDWGFDCVNTRFLGADTVEYWQRFHLYPKEFSELKLTSYKDLIKQIGGEYEKRPLFSPFSAIINIILYETTHIEFPERMFLIFALYASINSILFFYLLRLIKLKILTSLLLTSIITVSFSWISVFSIPESYSLSVLGAIVTLISGIKINNLSIDRIYPRILVHCLITGLASWLYLPISGAVFIIVGCKNKIKYPLLVLAISISAVSLIAITPQLVLNSHNLSSQYSYGQRWGSLANLIDVKIWFDILSSYFIFSIITPVSNFMNSSGNVDWSEILARPGAIFLYITIAISYFFLLREAIRRRLKTVIAGQMIWLIMLLIWNVFFNPETILLYLSVPLCVIFFIVATIIKNLDTLPHRTNKINIFLLFILLILLVFNVRAVFLA